VILDEVLPPVFRSAKGRLLRRPSGIIMIFSPGTRSPRPGAKEHIVELANGAVGIAPRRHIHRSAPGRFEQAQD